MKTLKNDLTNIEVCNIEMEKYERINWNEFQWSCVCGWKILKYDLINSEIWNIEILAWNVKYWDGKTREKINWNQFQWPCMCGWKTLKYGLTNIEMWILRWRNTRELIEISFSDPVCVDEKH